MHKFELHGVNIYQIDYFASSAVVDARSVPEAIAVAWSVLVSAEVSHI
jgi:hypothetical protein